RLLAANRTRRDGGNDVNDPQETCAGQDFRDAKMNQCGQRLRDRSPRGRSQPERVRRIGAPMNVSEKDTRDVARIWTDRRIPAACRGAVFHDQIVESSWSRSPRLSRVKSIFPCRPCMAIAWADISAVMSPRQYLGMAVRSEETSTIQPDVVRHQRGAQSRPFSKPRDRTASRAGTSRNPPGSTRPKHAVECGMANRMSTELRPSPQGVHVGIVGASGLVGDIILSILAERQFPVASLRLFASARSAGRYLRWKHTEILV